MSLAPQHVPPALPPSLQLYATHSTHCSPQSHLSHPSGGKPLSRNPAVLSPLYPQQLSGRSGPAGWRNEKGIPSYCLFLHTATLMRAGHPWAHPHFRNHRPPDTWVPFMGHRLPSHLPSQPGPPQGTACGKNTDFSHACLTTGAGVIQAKGSGNCVSSGDLGAEPGGGQTGLSTATASVHLAGREEGWDWGLRQGEIPQWSGLTQELMRLGAGTFPRRHKVSWALGLPCALATHPPALSRLC